MLRLLVLHNICSYAIILSYGLYFYMMLLFRFFSFCYAVYFCYAYQVSIYHSYHFVYHVLRCSAMFFPRYCIK